MSFFERKINENKIINIIPAIECAMALPAKGYIMLKSGPLKKNVDENIFNDSKGCPLNV